MHRSTAAIVCVLALSACETDREDAQEKVAALGKKASDAADATKKLAGDASQAGKKAIDTTKDAIDTTKDATNKVVATGKDAADKGKEWYASAAAAWAGIPGTGEFSETAKAWFAKATDEETIEAVVREGTQIAPVAVEIGRTLHAAIDSDTAIEPIYQKVPPGGSEQVDAAISDMPRTEVVDGLKIGFKQLDETTNSHQIKERGYLVTWRDGDHLYGFVYRSKRSIDIDKLVADTPRLLRLAKTAVTAD
ncbi:MAG: hypothetical protein ACRBN8_15445 [Nannocystales bacterium]